MYLKRIETKGFKSFADTTIINFDDGVTGIVGPNGSGKSNVVDAVRWVLGEQSIKQLRGSDNMTDIIFAGSSSRNAHNYAYVTVVLDNTDKYLDIEYSEVQITRKVYRSGESEYALNGTKCRLKDIAELIMDTGLGKDAFNIISQDKVQNLLNSKPEDRRYIFEEAAGVLKYRKRKESAQRKLEKASENFVRVQDILNELENQVEPLRIQAEQASKYISMKDELKSVEIALIAHEISELNYEYKASQKVIDELENIDISSANEEIRYENEINDLKTSINLVDTEIVNINEQIFKSTREVDSKLAQKNVLAERQKFSDKKNELVVNRNELLDQNSALKTSLSSLNEALHKTTLEYNGLKQVIDQIDLNLQTKRNDKSHQLALVSSYTSKSYQLDSAIKNYENLEQQNVQYLAGVRAVLNNKALAGIYDVVGNVINIDESYVEAIDASLGGSSQFIIAKDRDSVKHAVSYLVENNRGRATFLPLDSLQIRTVDKKQLEGLDYIGIASELVSCDHLYENAINHLLGNVIICSDLNQANKLKTKVKQYKIVTLDGSVVSTGGSITGGRHQKKNSIIGERHTYETNKKDLEQILNEIDKIHVNIKNSDTEITELENTLYQHRINLMQLDENITYRQENITNIEKKLEDNVVEIESYRNLIEDDEDEQAKLIIEIDTINETISNLRVTLENKQVEKSKLLFNLDELETKYKALRSDAKQVKKDLASLKEKVIRIEVNLDNYLEKLSEMYHLTFEKAFSEYELQIEVEEARVKVKRLNREIEALGSINMLAIEEYEEVRVRFDFLNEQKADLESARLDITATIEELDSIMKKEFKDTFDEVSAAFSIMFRNLFGGGSATLTLTDEHDLLNSGIEISVQPPGKKLQYLTLLSGGEKALTTLVLLFAILKVRPVPFCILDEVEAALDEANLARFAKFLNEFSMETQFIIITHRKVTMESTDVLYGVTMQESGVSKLVSVKLSEAHALVE